MKVLNVILIIIVVPVLFLTIIPAHEARIISHGKNQNQNMMNNYKDKLIGAIQQDQAPPYVPNPSSMMRQKALFVTNHTIDVSFSLRRLLGMGLVTPSGPNPPTHIPPKTSHSTAPPFLGSMEKSTPSSSMPKGSTSIP
ncbi:hypothetical protein CMV_025456 [Castanea mollissima]|uniref:Transmembrane protein n=1 Tax=Castanea mollissima TaxID=60419 RepID=A0A8J4QKR4_9ROSI|nr:hypothetical protein CMV_025456 [Castanea mollissima]